jgi:hypothetical protein
LTIWEFSYYFDVVPTFKACNSFSADFAPLNTLS